MAKKNWQLWEKNENLFWIEITAYNIKTPQLYNAKVLEVLSKSFAFDPFI